MVTHVGIELSPDACRIVELDGGPIEPGRTPTTRVRSYAILPPTGPEADGYFATLERRTVAVVVWGARAEHRQMFVANGSYERMRAEALTVARTDGVDTQGTLADITLASTAIKNANRQPVVLALARGQDISTALAPIVAARARIRSVITPAEALLGLARARQAFSIPGGIEAYVAMDRTATCLALVRDGSLLGTREMTWGYENGSSAALSAKGEARRDDLAARLIDELARLMPAAGEGHGTLTQMAICGGLPELRTMTITLMERLDVEVETLDSLFGIDSDHLPEQADDFRDQVSEIRLAWAAAADWNGPLNLMRHRHRRNRRAVFARAAVVGGIAAGLGAGWAVQRSQWWEANARGTIARATPPAALPAQRPQAPRAATPLSPPQPTSPVKAPPVIERPAPASTDTRTVPSPAVVPPAAPPSPTPAPPARSAPPPPLARPAPERLPSVALTQPSAAPAAPRSAPSQSVPARASASAPAPAPPVAARPAPTPPAPTPPVATPRTATPPVVTPRVPTPPVPTPSRPTVQAPAPSPLTNAPPPQRPAVPAPGPSASASAPPPRVSSPPRPAVPPPAPPAAVPSAPARPPAATPSGPAVFAPVPPRPVPSPPAPARAPAVQEGAPQTSGPGSPATVTPPRPAAPVQTGVGNPEVASPASPRVTGDPSVDRPTVAATRRPEPPPTPFDAVLGTILFSPDRKLAIVNGRIVGIGDDVNGARITDITLGSVLLRDARGRMRILTLGQGTQTPAAR